MTTLTQPPEAGEGIEARTLANRILDRISADPDDDLAVLSRQLLRADERIAALQADVGRLKEENARYKKHFTEIVEEHLQELKAESVTFDTECWSALRRLCEGIDGFSWRDYPEGLQADDAAEFIRETLNGIAESANRANPRAERAEAQVGRLRTVLKPFADAVFNDNGDVTIDTSDLRATDYICASSTIKELT